jgi:hypothetical protein
MARIAINLHHFLPIDFKISSSVFSLLSLSNPSFLLSPLSFNAASWFVSTIVSSYKIVSSISLSPFGPICASSFAAATAIFC